MTGGEVLKIVKMISDTFNRKNLKLISFISMVKERDPLMVQMYTRKIFSCFKSLKYFSTGMIIN